MRIFVRRTLVLSRYLQNQFLFEQNFLFHMYVFIYTNFYKSLWFQAQMITNLKYVGCISIYFVSISISIFFILLGSEYFIVHFLNTEKCGERLD